jgi:hypothetical protein
MLVDPDLRPQQTVYYATAVVLSALQSLPTGKTDLATVYDYVARRSRAISLDATVLALDYLFLVGLVQIDESGGLECI